MYSQELIDTLVQSALDEINAMRKITQESVSAFLDRETFSKANMSCDGTELKLHGNTIASHANGQVYITLAGWNSITTRERLTGLAQAMYDRGMVKQRISFVQRQHRSYIFDHHDGLLIPIRDDEEYNIYTLSAM